MRRLLIISALFIAVVFAVFDGMGPQNVNAQDTAPVDAGVQSPEKTGEPKSVLERRETRLRWAEDNYGVDVKTTATASRLITGQGAMPHEALEQRLMGYSMRTERYRFVIWKDTAQPDAEPVFVELYDHHEDPAETRNIAGENPKLVARLSSQFDAGWRGALK
jgi:hypothetical protein